MSYWILVANSSQAKIYESPSLRQMDHRNMRLVNQFEHPRSRQKNAELIEDRSGNYHSANGGYGNYADHADVKGQEAEQFAKELAQSLAASKKKGHFDQLVLVAPSHFDRHVCKHLNGVGDQSIMMHIDKDYTKDEVVKLAEHLSRYLH